MTEGELEALVDGICPPILKKILALSDRVKALEDRPASLKYAGVWDNRRRYQVDEAVTRAGGLWIARMESTGVQPGDGVCWQLAVKGPR